MTRIGKKIKELREEFRLSPNELAELMNMTKSNLQKIERDEIDLSRENTLRLTKIFGITVEDLHAVPEALTAEAQTVNHSSRSSDPNQNDHHSEIKMLYERLITSKDQIISEMQKEIDQFRTEKILLLQEISRLKNEIQEVSLKSASYPHLMTKIQGAEVFQTKEGMSR